MSKQLIMESQHIKCEDEESQFEAFRPLTV